MNNNYVIYDVNGLLVDSSFTPVSKGNNAVDMFYVHFKEQDYNTTYVTIAVTLPDGTVLPELATSPTEFTFNGVTYKGHKITLLEPLTAQAGVETLTFNLKLKEDDTKLCSSQLKVTIHDSDTPTEPTITDVQYQQMLQSISDNYNTLDVKKLDKDFSNLNEFTRKVTQEQYLVLNNGTYVEKIHLDKLYNKVESVNNILPDENKNIVLGSENIKYNDSNVANTLTSLEEDKANQIELDTAVFHREGTLIEGELTTNGLLNSTTDVYESGTNIYGRVILGEDIYNDGDIVDVTLDILISEIGGDKHAQIQFTRLVDTKQSKTWNVILIDEENNIYNSGVTMTTSGNILTFIVSDGTTNKKVNGISAIVRR